VKLGATFEHPRQPAFASVFFHGSAHLLSDCLSSWRETAVMEARCWRKPTARNPDGPYAAYGRALDGKGIDTEKLRSERPSGVGMHHAIRNGKSGQPETRATSRNGAGFGVAGAVFARACVTQELHALGYERLKPVDGAATMRVQCSQRSEVLRCGRRLTRLIQAPPPRSAGVGRALTRVRFPPPPPFPPFPGIFRRGRAE
jgi:hypothetical protein